ncbi:MAG: hypothetical protein J6A01_11390 [Proteobacteria bacterium]|nr:hypothetical protein [Pseudomonadota bacterium]
MKRFFKENAVFTAVLMTLIVGCSEDSKAPNSQDSGSAECDCKTGDHCDENSLAKCGSVCPEECDNGCDENGKCKTVCPEECTEGCNDDGTCKAVCPEECTEGCNDDGTCKASCPEECDSGCDENGKCKATCPEECNEGCNDDGTCKATCPEDCDSGCDENGKCKTTCPEECDEGCDDDGKCICPETCRTSCNDMGVCQCSEACPGECGEDGACLCPETCLSSCDVNGACQCPEICPDRCDGAGVCITKCGEEIMEAIWFDYTELDLLKPGSTGHTSYNMPLHFKTNKKTYTYADLPCKDDVVLETLDPSIATVAKNDKDPKAPTFKAVAPGTTTCVVSIKDQPGVTGTMKLHIINLDALNGDITENVDGKYVHLLKTPITLQSGGFSQGFDFYDENEQYFTRLTGPTPSYTMVVNGKAGNVKYTSTRTNVLIFKNDGEHNTAAMTFHNAGHGQNLSVEHTEDQDYLWFANFNTLTCTKKSDTEQECKGTDIHSQTISRVPWQEGVSFYPNQVPENYYYVGKEKEYHHFLEPGLDTKNNLFAFKDKMCVIGDDGKCPNTKETVRIYNLDTVKALKATQVTFPKPFTYLDNYNSLNTGVVSAMVKDLSTLKPIHEFTKRVVPIQGMEYENGIIYTIPRMPYLLETKEGKEQQYSYRSMLPIFVYTYDGEPIGGKDAIKDTAMNSNGGEEYVYFLGALKKTKVFVDTEQNSSCGKKNCHGENNRYCECEQYFMDNEKIDPMFHFTEIDESGEYDMQPTGFFEPEGIRAANGKLYLNLMVGYKRKSESGTTKSVHRQATLVYDLTKK